MQNNKLKICHIGWADSPHVNRILSWFARRGHAMYIITNKPYYIDGVTVYDLTASPQKKTRWQRYRELEFTMSWKWYKSLSALKKIQRIIHNISPDIIHTHSLWYPGYLGSYLNFHPYVVSVFNGDVLWKKDNVSFYEKIRTTRALKKADLIVGESQTLINAAIDKKADRKKTHIMKIGVDISKFNQHYDKSMMRRNLNLPQDAQIVLSPRSIIRFYNLHTLLKAFVDVKSIIQDVLLVFIGLYVNDAYIKELKIETKHLNIEDNVIFIGSVSHDNVAQYHQAADIFVSISPRDSGPMALQEAMACGNAPVISDLPSVRELIQDGWNGMLVNPKDVDNITEALIKILKNSQARKTYAERNWKIVQDRCNHDREMQKMEYLYYQLVDGDEK